MPTTRRSAARTSGPAKGQSTLTFHGKVTKNITKDLKEPIAKPLVPDVTEVKPKDESAEEAVKVDVADDVKDEQSEVEAEEEEEEEEEEEPEVEAVPERPEAEIKAEKITEAQIKKYWKAIEQQRIAPRVHQQDLGLNEKVLRYFDVSSQYGPCIGVTRKKRWQRAERLGLSPPIEVLAVLLMEEEKDSTDKETAHIDRIMNSTAIGASA